MSTVLTKPVRVIHELSEEERRLRAIRRVLEQRDAAWSRIDKDSLQKIKEIANGPVPAVDATVAG